MSRQNVDPADVFNQLRVSTNPSTSVHDPESMFGDVVRHFGFRNVYGNRVVAYHMWNTRSPDMQVNRNLLRFVNFEIKATDVYKCLTIRTVKV
jgi:hypothetical protein